MVFTALKQRSTMELRVIMRSTSIQSVLGSTKIQSNHIAHFNTAWLGCEVPSEMQLISRET